MFTKMIDLLKKQYTNFKNYHICKIQKKDSNIINLIKTNWHFEQLAMVEYPLSVLKLNISKIIPNIYRNILSSC